MKRIPLTQDQHALCDDEDYDFLMRWRWYAQWRPKAQQYYAVRNGERGKKLILMHRVIMQTPEGLQVDHINHDTLDNRRQNLRNCSNRENTRNRVTQSKHGVGVAFNKDCGKRPFSAKITVGTEGIYLGHFATAEEARLEYWKASFACALAGV